jgi:hypothetical protein
MLNLGFDYRKSFVWFLHFSWIWGSFPRFWRIWCGFLSLLADLVWRPGFLPVDFAWLLRFLTDLVWFPRLACVRVQMATGGGLRFLTGTSSCGSWAASEG